MGNLKYLLKYTGAAAPSMNHAPSQKSQKLNVLIPVIGRVRQ